MIKSVLLDREDIKKTEKEEKYLFIFSILEKIGLPSEELQECFPEDLLESDKIEYRLALKKLSSKYNLDIVQEVGTGVKIFVEEQLVAELKPPRWQLHRDLAAKQRNKQFYVEMFIETWSVFDEEEG